MLKMTFAGFTLGLLAYAVGREVWLALQVHSPSELIGAALTAVGSLRWIDTTLVTGLAAVGAAYFSVRAVREQIVSAERSAAQSVRLTEKIESERKEARRDAARAVLPLALSSICGYADRSGRVLYGLIKKCDEKRLPGSIAIPEFPLVPVEATEALKEMVEYSSSAERRVFAVLIGEIQVLSSRLRGLSKEQGVSGVAQTSLESYLADSVEIYARASDLFDFGRYPDARVPDRLSDNAISTGFHTMGVWNDELTSRVARQIVRDMKLRR